MTAKPRRRISPFLSLATLLALACPAGQAFADGVLTVRDNRVEGEIVYEDDEVIRLRTERYGELRFFKMNLKQIIRGSGETAKVEDPQVSMNQPEDPFGFAADTNPFGLGSGDGGDDVSALFGGGGDAGGAEPFGGFGGDDEAAGGFNPFSATVLADAGDASPFAPGATGAPALEIEEIVIPAVPQGIDGVLFGKAGEGVVQVRATEDEDYAPADREATNLLLGSNVKTDSDARARMVLRGGQDTVRLPERTEVELVEVSDDKVTIELMTGAIWSEVNSGKDFEVRTPVVTAGVVGTVFRVSDEGPLGYNIAVLEGQVDVASLKTQASQRVPGGKMISVAPDGVLGTVQDLDASIRAEWEQWDRWGAETIAGLGGIGGGAGGAAIQSIVSQNVQQQKEYTAIVQTTNRQIQINNMRDFIDQIANAFKSYAADTGHVPTTEMGFGVLRQNSADKPGWNGPYWDGEIPPRDAWNRPLRYLAQVSPHSGNVYGVVYSLGEDAQDNRGKEPLDMPSIIAFKQIESIQENPDYDAQTLLEAIPQEQRAAGQPGTL
ncbi:MAG: FecR domain-containing protein [Sumerlaeia bacterium]